MASRQSGADQASSSSSSAASTESEDGNPAATGSAKSSNVRNTFEQRRIRHISTLLLRNLLLPDRNNTHGNRSSADTSQRPLPPRRSLSVVSNASTHTLRRTPSNRTVRPSPRRRASSAASANALAEGASDETRLSKDDLSSQKGPTRPLAVLETWDAESLCDVLDSRLANAFICLSRIDDGQEIYRTCVSQTAGLHHGWGRTPNSDGDAAGIDLGNLLPARDAGSEDHVHIALWARALKDITNHKHRQDVSVRDYETIAAGTEVQNGFQLIWEQDVNLSRLEQCVEDPTAAFGSLPANTILIGLSHPIAHLTVDDIDDPNTGHTKDMQRKAKRSTNDVQLYIVPPPDILARSVLRHISQEQADDGVRLDKDLLRKRLKDGEISRAYDIDDILRLVQLQVQQVALQQTVNEVMDRIDSLLDQDDGTLARRRRGGEKEERLKALRAQRDRMSEQVKAKQNTLEERRKALQRRRARLEMARRMMVGKQKYYTELQAKIGQLTKVRSQVERRTYARRVTMLRQVEYIYPIELVDGAQLLFSIVDIPLANRDGREEAKNKKSAEQDDDVVSSALGMIGQMVTLISAYMDTPLHYPIATAGSRSVIQDGISVMSGPRAFPLFSKGVERYRFEYGHFLLNKDIEQLLGHAGITILDIRNTLPNLKNLIVTLTASSLLNSRLSRRNYVGQQLISLPNRGVDKTMTAKTTSLGLGLPSSSSTTNGGVNGKDQIGYGTVLTNDSSVRTPTSSERQTDKRASRWGMSLLGWGSVADRGLHDKQVSSTTAQERQNQGTADVPTVRKLGRH